ncbi:acyl-CoA dehydrogenase family protein [Xanthobacteraceae bacterium A53D]
MDDVHALVMETAARLFGEGLTHHLRAAAEQGELPLGLWQKAEEAGLGLAMVSEAAGGVGLAPSACAAIIRLAGTHAVPLPIAETMLANRLLEASGRQPRDGMLSVAGAIEGGSLSLAREGGGWRLAGTAHRVPYARCVSAIVVLASAEGRDWLAVVEPASCGIAHGENIALEPRDDVSMNLVLRADDISSCSLGPGDLHLLGAGARAVALAGALDRVLELTSAYVSERVQFGRALSKFQAIQQSLAVLATQVAAAGGAANLAAEALDERPDPLMVAAAKIRAGEAAGIAAGIAHQMHGAMGYSHEHSLHFLTKRLWAWREEFGNEIHWSRKLGADVLGRGADGLWPLVTAA